MADNLYRPGIGRPAGIKKAEKKKKKTEKSKKIETKIEKKVVVGSGAADG